MRRSSRRFPRCLVLLLGLVITPTVSLVAQELPRDESSARRAVIVNVRTAGGEIPLDTDLLEGAMAAAGMERVTETFKTDAFVAELNNREIARLEKHPHVYRVEEIKTYSLLAARTNSVAPLGQRPCGISRSKESPSMARGNPS